MVPIKEVRTYLPYYKVNMKRQSLVKTDNIIHYLLNKEDYNPDDFIDWEKIKFSLVLATFQSLPVCGASVPRIRHSSPVPHCGRARAAAHILAASRRLNFNKKFDL